jgi:glycosyltransferase involved in cell wall biosynthesis
VNIAIISPQIYPCDTGGVEVFNYFLVKNLASHGHKIWVFTCHDYNWKQKNIINVKLQKRLLLFVEPSIIFCTLLELKKIRNQIDVLHVPYTSNSVLAYLALLARKLFGICYLISIHGGGMYPWRAKIFHKLFFQQASEIVAVSTTVKEEYEKRSGRIIKVIPPLIPFLNSKISKNELRRTYGFNDNDIIILSLGSIKKIKGSDALLNAFLKLEKDYVEKMHLKLLYVGDGPLKPFLEKIVKKVRLTSCIKFFGVVPYEKVPEMYKLADIYVIPSLFEGTPKSLLEAMFNGLPVIGSDTNGINNIITNNVNGLLFKVSDEKDLSIKLKTFIENEDLRDRLIKSAKKSVKENYDCEKTVLEFIETYKNTIKKTLR